MRAFTVVLALIVAVCSVVGAQAACSGPDPFVGRDANGQMAVCPGSNGTVRLGGNVSVDGMVKAEPSERELVLEGRLIAAMDMIMKMNVSLMEARETISTQLQLIGTLQDSVEALDDRLVAMERGRSPDELGFPQWYGRKRIVVNVTYASANESDYSDWMVVLQSREFGGRVHVIHDIGRLGHNPYTSRGSWEVFHKGGNDIPVSSIHAVWNTSYWLNPNWTTRLRLRIHGNALQAAINYGGGEHRLIFLFDGYYDD